MSTDTFMYNEGALSAHAGEIQTSHGKLVMVLEDVRKADKKLIAGGKDGWESAAQEGFMVLQAEFEKAYSAFNVAVQKFQKETLSNGERVSATESTMVGLLS